MTNKVASFVNVRKRLKNNSKDILNKLKEMKTLNEQLELMIESSFDGIILSDRNGVIFKVNKSVEYLSGGIKKEEILGRTADDLETEGVVISQSKRILKKNPLTIKQRIRTGVELFITSNPVLDKSGEVLFYVANIRDMSVLYQLHRELEETKDLTNKYYCELQELRNRLMDFDDIVMKSPQMIRIMERTLKVAKTNANVLITGESGVGKEVVAKLLHKMSCRKEYPFIQINCGAIPENLLESELFGYEKGAFTDALKCGKPGFFEVANKGTILLDEIGDLPLRLQVKLLRAIQEKEIYRVGSTKPVNLDVRIIAATNISLEKLVAKKQFREDLYYRLNVVPIEIPALRERKMDIIPLALHFLSKINERHKVTKTLSAEACNIIEAYNWPGNVRELENIVERLVIISEHNIINKEHMPAQVLKAALEKGQSEAEENTKKLLAEKDTAFANIYEDDSLPESQRATVESGSIIFPLDKVTLKDAMDWAEKIFLAATLAKFKSKRSAARVLGVDHTTLVRKTKKFEI